MCTVVVSFQPGLRFPLLFLAVRDELLARPWLPPGRHWPDRPGLIGGLDVLAGGTWLAVDPVNHRMSCVLNGRGVPAEPELRRSRGELPLRGAAGEPLPHDLARLDPFHLITADRSGARLDTWDGESLVGGDLKPGISVVVNSGLDDTEPRAARLLDLLRDMPRPEPDDWAGWLGIAAGDDVAREDPQALIMRHTPGGVRYGSSSVTFVALGDELRYDFAAVPEEPGGPMPLSRVL